MYKPTTPILLILVLLLTTAMRPFDYDSLLPTNIYNEISCPTPSYDTVLVNSVEGVILHHTATPTAQKTLELFADSAYEASAHVVIDTDGTRYVFCQPEVVAWHAGKSILHGRESCNKFCIGIEFQGNTRVRPLYNAQICSALEYLAPIIAKHHIPYDNFASHEMVRKAYKEKYPEDSVYNKVDITPAEFDRFMEILRLCLPEEVRCEK